VQVLSDAYDIAAVAQHMTQNDPAFGNYFITDKHSQTFEKKNVLESLESSKVVPNIFRSFISGGGTNKKFKVACPGPCKDCDNAYAVTDYPNIASPEMWLCPTFFAHPTSQNYLISKEFTSAGWCTPPPHIYGHFMIGAITILHEMTHLSFILTHAVVLSGGPSTPIPGTSDILHSPDENDKNNRNTYAGGPAKFEVAAARVLKERWTAYLGQSKKPAKPLNNKWWKAHVGQSAKPLNKPPMPTTDNAESYAAAAIEHFFSKMCNNFDPKQVRPEL